MRERSEEESTMSDREIELLRVELRRCSRGPVVSRTHQREIAAAIAARMGAGDDRIDVEIEHAESMLDAIC